MVQNEHSNKRQLILESAKLVFAEKGFESTRIIDISAHANIGKGTIYEYFDSKSELLMASCEDICANNLSILQEALQDMSMSNGRTTAQILHFVIHTLTERIAHETRKQLPLFMDLWKEIQEDPTLFEEFRTRLVKPYKLIEAQISSLISLGQSQGEFKPDVKGKNIALLVTTAIDGLVWQLSFRDDLGAMAKMETLANTILQLLELKS